MLWRILRAHGGVLSRDLMVCFANTGKERNETLDFVARCAAEWTVPIVWLERRDDAEGRRFAVIEHATASRQGEPFEALIRKRADLAALADTERRPCRPDTACDIGCTD